MCFAQLEEIATLREVREALRNFASATSWPLCNRRKKSGHRSRRGNRPQPRRDVNAGNGMAAVVGAS